MIVNYLVILLSTSLVVIAIKSYKPFLEVCNGNKDDRVNKHNRIAVKSMLFIFKLGNILMIIGSLGSLIFRVELDALACTYIYIVLIAAYLAVVNRLIN